MTGAIVNKLRSDPDPFRHLFCLKGQRNGVPEKVKVPGPGHPVADNSIGITFKAALFRLDKEFGPRARHMASLARLSRLLPAVGASQPLPEGIVNNRIPKNSKMAWGAELAALLKPGIGVLARGDIVQWPGKELMLFKRSTEFVGKYSGPVGERNPRGGIEADIPDFMAEIAGDPLAAHTLRQFDVAEAPLSSCRLSLPT